MFKSFRVCSETLAGSENPLIIPLPPDARHYEAGLSLLEGMWLFMQNLSALEFGWSGTNSKMLSLADRCFCFFKYRMVKWNNQLVAIYKHDNITTNLFYMANKNAYSTNIPAFIYESLPQHCKLRSTWFVYKAQSWL